MLTTSMIILHLTGEHEVPEKRELVDVNERHLQTERNFQNGACPYGFDNGEAVLAIRSSSVTHAYATWQRVEIRPPHCACVVNIGVWYIFIYKPPRIAIRNKNFLSSRDVFCGLESVYVYAYLLCMRACMIMFRTL